MITIYLNGEPREVPEGLTLAGLLKWLDLPEDRIAVERNLEIVLKADWEKTGVSAGDRLEVVHFVGGGGSLSLEWDRTRIMVALSCLPAQK